MFLNMTQKSMISSKTFLSNWNVINKRLFHISIPVMIAKDRNDTKVSISEDSITLMEESNGVRKVTLNNPKKRNALSLSMIQSLRGHIVDSPSLRCLVINSNGPVFSSGHDLKELTSSNGTLHHQKVFEACSHLMCSIREIKVPVICQVKGIAAAAGCQLVASCDIAIATIDSQFSTPGASVGLFCSTPGIAVSRAANLKTAAYMLFSGKEIKAYEALQSGLVSRVVSDDQLEKETESIVNAILSKSKTVIALGKQFFYSQMNQDLHTAYANGSRVMVENLCLSDAQEGISAFIDKRTPLWSHTTNKAH